MGIIDFKKEKDKKNWQANKSWNNVKKVAKPFRGTLDLAVEEWFALKMLIDMFLENNQEEKDDYVCKTYKKMLDGIGHKIEKEVDVYLE